MFLITLFCLTISFYTSATYLGYTCNKDPSKVLDTIFLIEDNNKDNLTWNVNEYMNKEFVKACKNYYNISSGSLHEVGDHVNVIYFGFSGDDEEFMRISNILPGLNVIGDAIETKNLTCKLTNDSELICTRSKVVNLITPSIEQNFGEQNVYDLIQNMIGDKDSMTVTHGRSCAPVFQKTQNLKTVVLCHEGNTDISVSIAPMELVVSDVDNCQSTLEKYSNSLLALLTSKGFHHSSVHSVPTVFYSTPYPSVDDEAAFPNSVNLLPWRLLKFGFLGFIRSVGWERVVIVSDASYYSIEFEHELTTLFDKERIVYTSVKSEDPVFDIYKIQKKFAMMLPRIVILNLEEYNALYLMERAPKHRPITWIVRDMPKDLYYKQFPPHLFSIHLGAVTESSDCNVDPNILAGLSTIAHAYRNTADQDETLGRRMFYKRLSDEAKKIVQKQTAAMAFVYKLSKQPKLVSIMRVDDSGAKVLSFRNPFKSGKPADGTAQCLAKSYKYSEPCEDNYILLLMCVILLFFTTSLMISCYFHKTSPFHDPRYQNF